MIAPDRSRVGQPARPEQQTSSSVEQIAIRRAGTGLRAHDRHLAWASFTLFCTMTADRSVYLVDMDGELTHRWECHLKPAREGVTAWLRRGRERAERRAR
jgi:hypothetical protein